MTTGKQKKRKKSLRAKRSSRTANKDRKNLPTKKFDLKPTNKQKGGVLMMTRSFVITLEYR